MSLPPLQKRIWLAKYLHENPDAHKIIMTGADRPPSCDATEDLPRDASPLASLPGDAPAHADHAAFLPPLPPPPPLPAFLLHLDATTTMLDTTMATRPGPKRRLDDNALQRRDEARVRLLQAELRFRELMNEPENRMAQDRVITQAQVMTMREELANGPETRMEEDRVIAQAKAAMGGKLAVRAARQAVSNGRPIPRKPDGTVDIGKARRDRYDQIAFGFRIPGTDIYPFRHRGADGQLLGDRRAYLAYQARERARKVADEQGRPRFYDPATGEVDMKSYRKMRKGRSAQARS
ncbi:hypothetical protein [Xylophilus sp. GOD-11R]|uniref:hypothetical protein n=1 Tax=Xylophilus sp. GOD-11R TaxID=3089814 RepID=UPI00298CB981|nr:hypothetical protein [Xylophilus sp. GOD-11R]WPB56184.1 hypothetical protein R9X41_18860 [Xylophilus sp. GOD-11R]